MACDIVGQTLIAVHSSDPPSAAEWEAFLAASQSLMARSEKGDVRHLIWSAGGGPSAPQRQQIYTAIKGRNGPTAVVTANAFVRGIVGAISVFNPKIKVFKPDAASEALRYLGLSEIDGKAVLRALLKLQTELGLSGGHP
jgi:hypothetical protein